MSGHCFCGNLLFDDDHYLSKVLVQKQSLTCKSKNKKSYYNSSERRLKAKDICVHCREMGTESFLLCLHQVREHNMTNEYKYLPICTACIESDKKVVKIGTQDKLQTRKERIAIADSNK